MPNTTMGSCALCNRRPPTGAGYFFAGSVVGAIGLGVAVAAYRLRGADAVSGLACALSTLLGGGLLSMGVFRGMRTATPRYLGGGLDLSAASVAAGGQVVAKVHLTPDHTLHLRAATMELQAVETVAGEERVLRTQEALLPLPGQLREETKRELTVTLPTNWPATMVSPAGVTPHREVGTRVRVAVDADAHPLFVVDVPLTVRARG
ncbi:MAG: hypothetical protein M3Y59_24895 [Myxococcota bacterium]|nr:hypothetical protein [Myxococcota bacterium]